MTEERKACPRCGANHTEFERWLLSDDGSSTSENWTVLYRLRCIDCEYMPDHWEESWEEALRYWNTRFIEDALRAENERLKAEVERLQISDIEQIARNITEMRAIQVQAENERLRGALEGARQHGIKHLSTCMYMRRGECDCGVDELRKAIDEALKGGDA